MAHTQLAPEKITSPFQLMAAWFAMLVLLVSVLLTAAANIQKPDWAAGYLVVFVSIVILVVIACVLLMLTRFRPNLQEGKEYAEWLKDQNTYSSGYLVKQTLESRVAAPVTAALSQTRSLIASKAFLTSVSNSIGSAELVDTLRQHGFNAEIYEEKFVSEKKKAPRSRRNSEGIWIGSRLDSRSVIEAIKIAASEWSELKYLHLSNDGGDPPDYVHDQLFFGGATSAARRYGLKPWTTEELLALDGNMTTEEFHALIRTRYS